MEKYGFVYIWYDRKRKKHYIGSHWGNESDGYVCSSRTMRKAYRRRPETFCRRVIKRIYTSKYDLLAEEQRWLDMIPEYQFGKKYYNLNSKANSFSWWMSECGKKEVCRKIGKKNKVNTTRFFSDPDNKERWKASHWSRKPGAQEIHDRITQKRINHPNYKKAMKTRLNNHNKGKYWYTNGVLERLTADAPIGWRKGRRYK